MASRTMFCFRATKVLFFWEKYGKDSSSKRTKHINIQYFFITDRVSKEKVLLVLCPMGDMIGDYVTKSLQGALFQKFRDQIIGVTPARDPGPGNTDSSVGKTETSKTKTIRGKVKSLVPPCKKVAPQVCVGSPTRDRAKMEPRLVKCFIFPRGLRGPCKTPKKQIPASPHF
jgi:hypothetical protein